MSRIKDYPEATTMADDDILVIDGDAGTRKVKKSKFVEIISEHVDGEISEMRQDFQAGVETIYNAIVEEGVTPSASTPQACATGIHDLTEITWDEAFSVDLETAASGSTYWNTHLITTIDATNIVSITPISSSGISSAPNNGFYFSDGTSQIGYMYVEPNSVTYSGQTNFSFNTEYTVPPNCKKIVFKLQRVTNSPFEHIQNFSLKRQTKILH